MTDSEINIAVAWCVIPGITSAAGSLVFCNGQWSQVPNYVEDLNACAEMEKSLSAVNNINAMGFEILSERIGYILVLMANEGHPLFATARQRTKAFLKVKEKWIEP